MNTCTTISKNNYEHSESIKKTEHNNSKPCNDMFSPSFQLEDKFAKLERANYFTLSNNIIKPMMKTNSSDRLNNFIQRFSQQLVVNDNNDVVLDSSKKRFSLENQDNICRNAESFVRRHINK